MNRRNFIKSVVPIIITPILGENSETKPKAEIEELLEESQRKAEEWYKKVPPNFYRDMQQDLRAFGRSEEHIWHEFITGAFEAGYWAAKKEEYEMKGMV